MKQILILFFTLFFLSCSSQQEKPLSIAVNAWVGYTPLFYAKEKHYLDDINVKLISTVSLGESMDIFSVKKVDLLTATQHETNVLKKLFPTIIPIILIDRSNGGDMILSNQTIDELTKAEKIDVYLEIDSINSELIKDFITKYKLDPKKMNFINKDQSQIADLPYSKNPILIVTYTPYNLLLMKKGYREIASTKDINTLLVVDAICTTKETLEKNREQLIALKRIIDKSIEEIRQSPKDAYETTKIYLNNISYQEFQDSMNMIQWINHPSNKLLHKLQEIHYIEENIIQ